MILTDPSGSVVYETAQGYSYINTSMVLDKMIATSLFCLGVILRNVRLLPYPLSLTVY